MKEQAQVNEKVGYSVLWTVTKYQDQAAFESGNFFERNPIPRNLLLNEGITALLNLLAGEAETAFNNANSYIGVGDSNTAAAAAQTGLVASENLAYVAVEDGYPDITDQTITWRAIFDGDTANFAWNEFTVANGDSNSADNLNRRVSAQGTKASGQIWTVDVAITFS